MSTKATTTAQCSDCEFLKTGKNKYYCSKNIFSGKWNPFGKSLGNNCTSYKRHKFSEREINHILNELSRPT